jgi:hypothetical protein
MKDFCVKLFNLKRGVYIRCFCTLKVCEKIDLSSSWFFVSGWVWFSGWFFKAMNEFVMVSRVFWVKNGLQNRFFSQKSIDFDFLATTMTRICAKLATCYLFWQVMCYLLLTWLLDSNTLDLAWLSNILGLTWLSDPRRLGLIWLP